jgi:hypothetical protein
MCTKSLVDASRTGSSRGGGRVVAGGFRVSEKGVEAVELVDADRDCVREALREQFVRA